MRNRQTTRTRASLAALFTLFVSMVALGVTAPANADHSAYTLSQAGGSGQATELGTAFDQPLLIAVFDAETNTHAADVAVTFTAPASGPSGTFAGGSTTATVTTNSTGLATAPTFTANDIAGSYQVEATAAHATSNWFALENLDGDPSKVLSLSRGNGSGQAAQVNTAFGTQMSVAAFNAAGAHAQGVDVVFTAPASGASGTFAGGSTTATVTTNSTGLATAPPFTANGTTGDYSVSATVDGSQTVDGEPRSNSFGLRNTLHDPDGIPNTVSAAAGNGQHATVLTAFSTNLQVAVFDGNNAHVVGAQVVFTAPESGASGTFADGSRTYETTTDAQGLATASEFTANDVSGGYSVGVTATKDGVTAEGSIGLTNSQVDTSTTLMVEPSSQSYHGEPVTLTATMTSVEGAAVPSGPVDFTSDGTPVGGCAGVTPVGGEATCVTDDLLPASYEFRASYTGDDATRPSQSAVVGHEVQPSADLAISVESPQHVATGTEFGTHVTVTNHGPSASSSQRVAFTVPDAGPNMFDSAESCQVTAVDVIACDLPDDLAAGDQYTFEFRLVAGSNLVDLGVAVDGPENDPAMGNNSVVAATDFVDELNTDLQLSITGPDTMTVGGAVQLVLTMSNDGPMSSGPWTVAGNLSNELDNPTTTAEGCNITGATLTCAGDNLDNGDVRTVIVDGLAPTTSTTIAVDASVDGSATDPNEMNNTAEFSVTVAPDNTTGLVLNASETAVDAGDSVTITATGIDQYGNSTGDVTNDVVFTSDVATDIINANTVTFPTASLHTITGTHTGGGTGSVEIEVSPIADLAVSVATADTVTVGDDFMVEFTVTNHGPSPSGPWTLTGQFPDDLVDATATAGCTISGTTLECDHISLDDGASTTFTISGSAPETATAWALDASVSGNVADPIIANNEVGAAVSVVAGPTTALTLSVPAATVDQGGSVTISAGGTDRFGNPTGDVTDDVVFTSDVATDVVDGNTVTFPTASPHTITGTHIGGATATIVVEVTPQATTTTTVAPTTTTSTAPTTTTEPSVSTTTAPTTTTEPSVSTTTAPTTTTRIPTTTPTGELPATGSSLAPSLVSLAGLLLFVGAALLAVRRRVA